VRRQDSWASVDKGRGQGICSVDNTVGAVDNKGSGQGIHSQEVGYLGLLTREDSYG
jgi:hypothetical protein